MPIGLKIGAPKFFAMNFYMTKFQQESIMGSQKFSYAKFFSSWNKKSLFGHQSEIEQKCISELKTKDQQLSLEHYFNPTTIRCPKSDIYGPIQPQTTDKNRSKLWQNISSSRKTLLRRLSLIFKGQFGRQNKDLVGSGRTHLHWQWSLTLQRRN